jgi:2,3-bisphosphoglycerate-dependent phosphoglycerate mutase
MSLTILERQPEGWKPLLHNCTLHLSDAEIKTTK